MNQLAVRPDTLDAMIADPLSAAPAELRPAVYAAWLPYRSKQGMETPLEIAVMVGLWSSQHGYEIGALKAALGQVTHPRHAQKIQFGHQLLCELASIICPPETDRERTLRKMREARDEIQRAKREGD